MTEAEQKLWWDAFEAARTKAVEAASLMPPANAGEERYQRKLVAAINALVGTPPPEVNTQRSVRTFARFEELRERVKRPAHERGARTIGEAVAEALPAPVEPATPGPLHWSENEHAAAGEVED